MDNIKNNFKSKLGRRLYTIYFLIGAITLGILAACVIFTVIMRYCFSLNWKQLSEFNVTAFAFTTFWSMGICVLGEEHVMIDIFYDMVKPSVKRWLTVVNYTIVLIVDLVFTYFAWKYTKMAGIQISQGMEIPMYYMYGIMPVSGALCAVCTVIKIREFIEAPLSRFAPRNAEVKPEDALLNQQKGEQ